MSIINSNQSRTGSAASSDRRQFIKSTAMAAATAALAANTGRSFALPILDNARVDDRGVKWDKAPCRFCGTGCHVQVGVKDGRVVAIAGDVKADVNRGLLCVKGYHVGKVLYGKDRLTKAHAQAQRPLCRNLMG
jgi:nitrate reductase (cytochrome)